MGKALLILLCIFVTSCACRKDTETYKPTKNDYVLIQCRSKGMQRFQYVIDPSYRVLITGNSAEIWKDGELVDSIPNVSAVTFGPKSSN